MRGYFGLNQVSPEEREDILSQHKSLYNGYQTMQPKVSNQQPLTVFDARGDKEGAVINNKGRVMTYTNMGINESEEPKEVCDECGAMITDGVCECNYGHMEEEVNEGSNMCECGGEMYEGVCNECGNGMSEGVCNECGGGMYEGVCNECGYGKMEEETGHLDDIYSVRDLNLKNGEFDYVEGGGNNYGTFEKMHKKLYKEDREDMLNDIINSMFDDDEDEGFVDVEDFEPADEFIDDETTTEDDDDFMDFEPSYTEDGVKDPDNEDDGFEDINTSEVSDGELDEIDVEKLQKGKKYKYKHPEYEDEVEFDSHHDYPEGGERTYHFRKDKTGYVLGKKTIEDLIDDIEDEELDEQGFGGGGNAPDMDISNVKSAYNFESGGPNTGYPVFEDDMYGYDPEKMYETMESAWADDEVEEEMDEQTDISGVQGVYGDMDPAYDFDSNGPGIAGPYQHSSWGGGSVHNEEEHFEEVDEDLKESFLTQRNKINEMFSRFKKYN